MEMWKKWQKQKKRNDEATQEDGDGEEEEEEVADVKELSDWKRSEERKNANIS